MQHFSGKDEIYCVQGVPNKPQRNISLNGQAFRFRCLEANDGGFELRKAGLKIYS